MKVKGLGAQLEVARIQSEINRLFESLLRMRDGGAAAGVWTPGVDVAETNDHVILEADLPGVTRDSLELLTQSGHVLIRGDRPISAARRKQGAELLHDEREYGPFEVVVAMNTAVNTSKARAKMVDGVLRVEFPKVTERRRTPIKIDIEWSE